MQTKYKMEIMYDTYSITLF